LFCVLTGQAAQHRAADPDGSLLASAYRTVGPATRAALREAIAEAGHLDLVRVVAGAGEPGRAQHITADEREYLTSQLAGRRDWDRLWRLVKDLPLANAVAAMPLFGERWRPDGDRDRALFDQLSYPDARALAAARAALIASIVDHIGLDDHAVAGSFSPDGRRLAVATRYAISVFEMPDLTLAERYSLDVFGARRLLDVGDAVIACGEDRRWTFNQPSVLVRYAGGRGTVLRRQACQMLLAPHPAGFAVLDIARGSNQWHREGGYRLQLRTASGAPLRNVSVPADLGFTRSGRWPWVVAADLDTGKIALGGDRLWILDPDATRVLASCDSPGPIAGGIWIGGDRIAAVLASGEGALNDSLSIFRVAGSKLHLEATSGNIPDLGGVRLRHPVDLVLLRDIDLVCIPERGEIAMVQKHDHSVVYLDAEDLASIGETRELTGHRGTRLWASPDGHYHALAGPGWRGREGTVEVVDRWLYAVAELADRPMAALGSADLDAVKAAIRDALPGSPALPFLVLLRARLEYRFGTDDGIDPATWLSDEEYDVALGRLT
jgi:hypothetical protein